jgi:quinol monooxygenase YgiN
MIVTTIRMQTTPENRRELMQTFRSLSNPILSEHGCKSCRMYSEVGDEQTVIVIQEWDSKNRLDKHLLSNEFAVMVRATNLLKQPETVEFQVLDQLEGSRSVEAIRARNFHGKGENDEFPKTKQHGR